MGLSGVGSGTTFPNIEVMYEQQQYTINGQPASEDEVNKALAGHGIVANHGVFKTVDGFEIKPGQNPGVTTVYGGATGLPDGPGGGTDTEQLQSKAAWLEKVGDGALMWHAMSEMARVSQREMKDARDLRTAMTQGKIQAKQAQINATEQQIEAEREAAGEALTTAVITATVTAAVSLGGAAIGSSTSQAWGGAVTGIASSVGQVAQKWGEYETKVNGAGRTADDKRMEAKRYEMMEAVFDDSIDSAKNTYEEAKEQFKLALRIMSEHVERQSQVIQKITS